MAKNENPPNMFLRGASWYSEFYHAKKRYVKSHGRVSLSIAKEKHAIFYADVLSGRYEKQMQAKKQADKQGMTFADLANWYLELPQVQNLTSFKRVEGCFRNFNAIFYSAQIN